MVAASYKDVGYSREYGLLERDFSYFVNGWIKSNFGFSGNADAVERLAATERNVVLAAIDKDILYLWAVWNLHFKTDMSLLWVMDDPKTGLPISTIVALMEKTWDIPGLVELGSNDRSLILYNLNRVDLVHKNPKSGCGFSPSHIVLESTYQCTAWHLIVQDLSPTLRPGGRIVTIEY
jgi:hypothetical protein